jgi:hypothetical protein
MIGLPRESRKMIFETIKLNKEVKPDFADFGCFFPFRGTLLGDLAVDDGTADPDEIAHSRSSHAESIMHMPQIDAGEISGIMKMHYFYLNYPEALWPVFRLCEKDGACRDLLYKFLQRVHEASRKLRGR